ncbi:MAG: ParA family protein [Pirellula sp.]
MKFPKTQVIALANQKGGCGKTTSSISIAAAFNKLGYSVAIVDTDPQCNATTSFGVNPDELYSAGKMSLLDAFVNKRAASDIQIGFGDRFNDRLFVVPGNRNLSSVGPRLDLEVQVQISQLGAAEVDAEDIRREQRFRLRKSIDSLRGIHDVVIIDTPPNLDFLMTAALVAADWFIIPVFPSGFDLQGLETLTGTINKVRERYNPGLQLAGVLLGNFDKSAKLDSQLHALLVKKFGDAAVFQNTIGRSVRMRELTVLNRTVFEHEPAAAQGEQFLSLVREMINRASKGENTAKPLAKLEEVISHAASQSVDFRVSPEMLEVGNG